jgi:hypothetical protein
MPKPDARELDQKERDLIAESLRHAGKAGASGSLVSGVPGPISSPGAVDYTVDHVVEKRLSLTLTTPCRAEAMAAIRELAIELGKAMAVSAASPDYRARALDRLQEAVMIINAGIADGVLGSQNSAPQVGAGPGL